MIMLICPRLKYEISGNNSILHECNDIRTLQLHVWKSVQWSGKTKTA